MKLFISLSLFVLYASTVFAANGVRINGDLILSKETDDPFRVLYFSNGSSQQFASPWSISGFSIYYNAIGGKVGIGNESPSTELDVSGTVKAISFQGDGTDLTGVAATSVADNSVTNSSISGTISSSKLDLSGVQKKYGKVAVVALSGGDYSDPVTALAGSGTWCKDPSAATPCLLKIMPGVYTVPSAVVMRPYIDIEGSGEKVTKITSALSSPTPIITVATVIGADNAEIRFLTVENTSTGYSTVAILNLSASPSILHVSAISNGAIALNYAIRSESASSLTLTNVTASATGGASSNIAISNGSSAATMTNVTAYASGAINDNTGISNSGDSPNMTNVKVTAKGGANCYGVQNMSTAATMTNVNVTASGGTQNIGVYCYQAYPTMTNVTITASGGTNNVGVSNSGFSDSLTGIVKINHSVIKGATNTIINAVGGTTLVGNSQLDGGTVANDGIVKCAGVYDENYDFFASTCP